MHEKDAKGKAADFLSGLQAHLNKNLRLQTVKDWIHEKGKAANEGLFLEELVLPAIPTYLQQNLAPPATDTHDERIRKAFLAESTKVRDEGLASKSPASAKKYLFTKVGGNPKQIVNLWWDKGYKKGQTTQSCPDWAFRAPCPYTVVFEGKLFRNGSTERGRTELLNGIYQCFYYRAHPQTPEDEKHPAWNYDYACLFAYDVSENKSLVTAWDELNQDVKDSCWDSANLFVMVLPTARDTV